MKAMFSTITKVGKWKWELDVAAQRQGKRYDPEAEAEAQEGEERVEEAYVGPQPGQDDYDMGNGMDTRGDEAGYFEVS